jgi:hypothetical protein
MGHSLYRRLDCHTHRPESTVQIAMATFWRNTFHHDGKFSPACDLLVGKKNANPEEALAAFSSWGAVLGSNASYTRMALSVVDNYFRKPSIAAPVQPTGLMPFSKSPRHPASPDRPPKSPFQLSPASDCPPRASLVYPASPGEGRGAPATCPTGDSRGGIRAAVAAAAAPESERMCSKPLSPRSYDLFSYLLAVLPLLFSATYLGAILPMLLLQFVFCNRKKSF